MIYELERIQRVIIAANVWIEKADFDCLGKEDIENLYEGIGGHLLLAETEMGRLIFKLKLRENKGRK